MAEITDDLTITAVVKNSSISTSQTTRAFSTIYVGAPGERGDPGPEGPTGPQGATGSQGVQGVQGAAGATGATGPQGPEGPQGIKGDKGDKGDTGETGPQGPTGETGPAGGIPTTGTAQINFGAHPGSNEASIAVTGQTGITGASVVAVWFAADDTTSDHTAADHRYAPALIALAPGAPSAGTGFTIHARSLEKITGIWAVRWSWI
jgi:hypothetical protein